MRIYGTAILLISAMVMVGCASGPQVKTLVENHIKGPVYYEGLTFDKSLKPADEDATHWTDDTKACRDGFTEAMLKEFPAAKPAAQEVRVGLIAKPRVTQIERKFNPVFGGVDYLYFEVDLVDASSQAKVAVLNFKADSDGGMSFTQYSFWGRMGYAGENGGEILGKYFSNVR